MDRIDPPSLTDRLRDCAALWIAANDSSEARLGRAVLNDGAFFARMGQGRGPSTDTLEKFARFLADPANWPEGNVPDEARAFAHVTGVSVAEAAPSAGKGDDISREEAA